MENAGPTNHHRLILLDPRQATHWRSNGRAASHCRASIPTTVTRPKSTTSRCRSAALRRTATVRCSLFHGEPRDGVVERVHVLELHGGAALEWRPARALLSELVGDDRRALELWLATRASSTAVNGRCRGGTGTRAVGSNGVLARVAWVCPFEFVSCGRGRRLACSKCNAKQRRRTSRRCRAAVGSSLLSRDGCPRRSRTSCRG